MSNKVGQLLRIMIDNLTINNIVHIQLKRNSQCLAFRGALTRAYATWAPHHWEWVDYSFNEYFLTHRAASRLIRYLEDTTWLDPAELAQLWAEQFMWFDEEMRQRHMAQLIPTATHFLSCLEAELRARPEFQPNFDSHARQISSEVTMQIT